MALDDWSGIKQWVDFLYKQYRIELHQIPRIARRRAFGTANSAKEGLRPSSEPVLKDGGVH